MEAHFNVFLLKFKATHNILNYYRCSGPACLKHRWMDRISSDQRQQKHQRQISPLFFDTTLKVTVRYYYLKVGAYEKLLSNAISLKYFRVQR